MLRPRCRGGLVVVAVVPVVVREEMLKSHKRPVLSFTSR